MVLSSKAPRFFGLVVVILSLAGIQTAPAAAQTAPATCDLVDNGEFERLEQVRFTAAHPDRHSRIFGIGLTDTLAKACDTLLANGFTVTNMDQVHVEVGDIGQIDGTFAHYTNVVTLAGPVTNPLDGTAAEAKITLVASSPATYSSVEYLSVSFSHGTSLTLEEWTALVTDYLGPASSPQDGYSPSWVVSGQTVDIDGDPSLCDMALVDYRVSWWDAIPPIDMRADFDDSIPAHDGRDCTVLVRAEPGGSEDDGSRIGWTRLDFIDYQSISANRRAENAHVRARRYPID